MLSHAPMPLVETPAVRSSSKEHQTIWFLRSVGARTRTPASQWVRKVDPTEETDFVNHDYTFPFYWLTSDFYLIQWWTHATPIFIFFTTKEYAFRLSILRSTRSKVKPLHPFLLHARRKHEKKYHKDRERFFWRRRRSHWQAMGGANTKVHVAFQNIDWTHAWGTDHGPRSS